MVFRRSERSGKNERHARDCRTAAVKHICDSQKIPSPVVLARADR
jgi:hypothetical protein